MNVVFVVVVVVVVDVGFQHPLFNAHVFIGLAFLVPQVIGAFHHISPCRLLDINAAVLVGDVVVTSVTFNDFFIYVVLADAVVAVFVVVVVAVVVVVVVVVFVTSDFPFIDIILHIAQLPDFSNLQRVPFPLDDCGIERLITPMSVHCHGALTLPFHLVP